MNECIYLDACATTPIRNNVLDEIMRVYKCCWGNPSSLHREGVLAAEILEKSRQSIATKFNASYDEVIFTSGASQSSSIALNTIANNYRTPGRIVISEVEHPIVILIVNNLVKQGWDVDYWPVDKKGNIDLSQIDNKKLIV